MSGEAPAENPYQDLIERIAKRVVAWRLTVPAIVILESSKPLSFLGSQILVFFEPIVQSLFDFKEYRRFYEMIEDRQNIELLIQEIEKQEERFQEEEKARKAARSKGSTPRSP